MKIDPILPYFIYDGSENDLYAAMLYKRIMDSTETSDMHYHALIFLPSFVIGQWRLNDSKPFLPQSQFFGMLPPGARRWAHSQFSHIFPTQHTGIELHQCSKPTGPQQRPTNNQHIPTLQMNTSGISVYQIYSSAIQVLLTHTTMTA